MPLFASSEPSAQATSTIGTMASAVTISGRMPSSISRSRIAGFVVPITLARASREAVRCCISRRRAMARSFLLLPEERVLEALLSVTQEVRIVGHTHPPRARAPRKLSRRRPQPPAPIVRRWYQMGPAEPEGRGSGDRAMAAGRGLLKVSVMLRCHRVRLTHRPPAPARTACPSRGTSSSRSWCPRASSRVSGALDTAGRARGGNGR